MELENVINFLNNKPYIKETINEDAKKVYNMHNKEVDDYLDYLKFQRQQEVNSLLALFKFKKTRKEFDYMLYNEYFPFKNSQDAYVESLLFGYDIEVNCYFFIELIKKFMSNYDLGCYEEYLTQYIRSEMINLASIKEKRFKPHPNNIYPNEDKLIENQINLAFTTTNPNLYAKVVGQYAEYIIYKYLIELPNVDVIWVSRYIGDGYGYDLLLLNKLTNELSFIEVKGTLTKDNPLVKLSQNETLKLNSINSDDKSYTIYKVYIEKDRLGFYSYIKRNNQDIYYIDENGNLQETDTQLGADNKLYITPKLPIKRILEM